VPYSLVVVTCRCADYLAALVASMNEHLDEEPQLVVVDNASDDDPEAAARCWRGETTFVRLPENAGFGAACNIGVGRASHEAVVLLNPDTELVDGSLHQLAALALRLGALVGPRVLNPDGSRQPSASGSPLGVWPWVNALWPGKLMPRAVQARTEPWRLERRTRVAWLSGCCIAAPRDVLLRAGPFDESIHLYGEDMELGLRLGRSGIQSVFAPESSRIVHHRDGSSARLLPDRGRALAERNRALVLRRLAGDGRERRARAARRLNLTLRVVAKRVLRRPHGREVDELDELLALDVRPPAW
jgi:N-acetylglucosaminyl-diphospho-decaprenol L-rhamnosyltransferase